jgi:hypothetical protein
VKKDGMTEFTEKYINPFTDYGFKKLFGEEPREIAFKTAYSGIITHKIAIFVG